jgi:hypothetical protein
MRGRASWGEIGDDRDVQLAHAVLPCWRGPLAAQHCGQLCPLPSSRAVPPSR